MKRRTIQEYARALYEIAQQTAKAQTQELLDAFVRLLVRDRTVSKAHLIINEYDRIAQVRAGIASITMVTAQEHEKRVERAIAPLFGATVHTTSIVDPSIIGGMIIRTDDMVFDASVKTQLRRLQVQLGE